MDKKIECDKIKPVVKDKKIDGVIMGELNRVQSYRKSNFFIGAKYRSTLLENKTLAVSLAKLQKGTYKEDSGMIIVDITAAEMRRLLNDTSGSIYSHLEQTARRMTGRSIGMSDFEKKEFDYIAIVIRASYKDGVFTIKFNPEIREYLLDIRNKFTLLNLHTMMEFNSVYAFRTYEILKSEAFQGNHNCQLTLDGFEFVISVSELKLELGVIDAEDPKVKKVLESTTPPDYDLAIEAAEKKRFVDWGDFRKRVLKPVIEEINSFTDMKLDFDPIRSGRGGKISYIAFKIVYKDKDKKIDNIDINSEEQDKKIDNNIFDLVDAVKAIIHEDVSTKDCASILAAANYNLDVIREKYKIASNAGKIRNLVGWMISAINEQYQPGNSKNTEQSSDFMHQVYDFDEIEESLLCNK